MAKKAKKETLSLEERLAQALVPEDKQPYKVPDNWVWTRLGCISSYIQRGKSPKYCDINEIPVISQKCIQWNGFNPEVVRFIAPTSLENYSEDRFVRYGDILWNSTGTGTIGRVNIYKNELANYPRIVTDSHVTVVRPFKVISDYVAYYLRHPRIQSQIENMAFGTTNQIELNTSTIINQIMPLPPLAEQQRIVDRIESLFAKLDAAKELAQSALDSFKTHKAAILHKAFTGELTAKWRAENGGNVSLEDIIKTRTTLGLSKELKAYISELNGDNIIDSNGWLRLKAMLMCENITCGGTPTGQIMNTGDIPFLKVYNIVNNQIAFFDKPQYIPEHIHNSKLRSSMLMPDDVVMNIVGPPLRKIALIPADFPAWNMNQAIIRFRTIEYLVPKFLYYCLIYPSTLDAVVAETKGVVGQANISVTQSRNLIIPIPSIIEQQKIVRILDAIFEKEHRAKELCDVIDKIDLMKKAILARAFRGELGTNDPTEESALELLRECLGGVARGI